MMGMAPIVQIMPPEASPAAVPPAPRTDPQLAGGAHGEHAWEHGPHTSRMNGTPAPMRVEAIAVPERPNATLLGVPAPQAALEPPPERPPPPAAMPPVSTRAHAYNAAHEVPLPERSSARLHDMSSLRPDMRTKVLVAMVAAFSGLVFIGVIGLVIGVVRKKPSEIDTATTTSGASAPPVA